MKTTDLIFQLAQKNEPIKRLPKPFARLGTWMCISALCLLVSTLLIGLRENVSVVFQSPWMMLETAMILVVSILAATSAFILSVPGLERHFVQRYLPFFPIGLWLMILLLKLLRQHEIVGQTAFALDFGIRCSGSLILLSVVPGLLLFAMIRRASPLKRRWSGGLAILAAGGMGAFGEQFMCANESAIHLMVWHFVPAIAIGLFGVYLGRLLLKKI